MSLMTTKILKINFKKMKKMLIQFKDVCKAVHIRQYFVQLQLVFSVKETLRNT